MSGNWNSEWIQPGWGEVCLLLCRSFSIAKPGRKAVLQATATAVIPWNGDEKALGPGMLVFKKDGFRTGYVRVRKGG